MKFFFENNKYKVNNHGLIIDVDEKIQAKLRKVCNKIGKVKIGVRPEHIKIVKEKEGISAVVNYREMMGSNLYIHFTSYGKNYIMNLNTVDMQLWQKRDLHKGMEFNFSYESCHMHLFDAYTENNLIFEE